MKDTIYREDAIKALRLEYPTMPMFKNLREEWAIKTEGFRKAEEVIMSIPSADRPQAEWRDVDGNFVPLDEDGCTPASAWCSNCGEWLTGSDEYWTSGRFCPNCGCRMKGADDE